ncbi:KAP family NTPase [Photobacterium kishitanii]|uniref:KAP family NTPase n=1 Tax=Photobacterium kishitanii TaxID=318456 RepID=UPI00043649B8|nr:KAP family NTPase [Photobacterium kishitanii]CEO41948.1 conserved hypothetical protein [Photobacterium kishitanii]
MTKDNQITFRLRDEFNREDIAIKVIKLLRSEIQISPLVIDGSWGLGKTEFCHKLIHLMCEEDTHHLIYIDAFKADHANEPLLTVLAKVLEVLPDKNEKRELTKKAMPALRYSLKVGGKALVSHLLRQDADSVIEGFEDEVQKVADKAIDASVESLLKDHIEAEKNLKGLQDALKIIADKKPIVLFVDELDRCRPDFAVLMLETIKHTFDVDGVQFVLVTNTNQLKASINHCYGNNIDAQRYLDKFIKFTFTLPNTINENSNKTTIAAVRHYTNSVARSTIIKDLGLDKDACLGLMKQVITINNLSLREVETLVRHMEIYQTVSGGLIQNTHWVYKLMRLLGVLITSLKPDLANAILLNQLDAKRLGEFVGVDSRPKWEGGHPYPAHHEVLVVILGMECRYNQAQFVISDPEQIDLWNDLIHGYFNGCHWPPEEGERLKIVQETVEAIYLSN